MAALAPLLRRYEIFAIGVPPSPNRPMHWRERARRCAPIVQQLQWAAKAAAPRHPLQHAHVHVTLIHARPFDADNAYAACKKLIDALKGILIVDDSPKHITLLVDQARGTKPHEKAVRIVVEELA